MTRALPLPTKLQTHDEGVVVRFIHGRMESASWPFLEVRKDGFLVCVVEWQELKQLARWTWRYEEDEREKARQALLEAQRR